MLFGRLKKLSLSQFFMSSLRKVKPCTSDRLFIISGSIPGVKWLNIAASHAESGIAMIWRCEDLLHCCHEAVT